jgi:hypothetical protein
MYGRSITAKINILSYSLGVSVFVSVFVIIVVRIKLIDEQQYAVIQQ